MSKYTNCYACHDSLHRDDCAGTINGRDYCGRCIKTIERVAPHRGVGWFARKVARGVVEWGLLIGLVMAHMHVESFWAHLGLVLLTIFIAGAVSMANALANGVVTLNRR